MTQYSCSSASAKTTSIDNTLVEFNTYKESNPQSDSVLVNIESKVENAFIKSISTNEMSHIEDMYNNLKDLDKEKPNDLIKYWMAYTAYKQAICYIKTGDKKNSEAMCDRGVTDLNEKEKMNSEDFALMSHILSFSIQFQSGLGAASVSKKVKKNAEKALKLNDKNLRAYFVLGSNDFYTPEKYGGGKKTEEYLTKAIACDKQVIKSEYFPSWGKDSAYELLIKHYIKKKEIEKAKETFREAIKEFPNNYMISQLAQKLI